MTLRTIESEFSDQLLAQSNEEFPLDLRLEGPIMTKFHPKILWAQLQLKANPQQLIPNIEIPGWNYACFANSNDAQKSYPQIDLKILGKPWTVYQFLESHQDQAIIDFPPLGTIVLSRNKLNAQNENASYQYLLSLWSNYALSPELWGTQGKWPRFHAKLHKIFSDHHLLESEPTIGHYPLIDKASRLEALGFVGSRLETSYLIVLPWTFSLAALEKLEKIILQEF